MSDYHVPKPHHPLPIQYGEVIEVLCDIRIRVISAPQSVSTRDVNLGGTGQACSKCTNLLKSGSIKVGFKGEEITTPTEVQENQATA